MSDDERYEAGHVDTPYPSGEVRRKKRPHSDPIDTPYPTDGIQGRPPAPPSPEPRFWRLRQRANPYFMGRETIMTALHNTFQAHPIVHLHGPLGSGSSQTALAYAFRARANFDGAFWIDARHPTLARLDLVRAGRGLNGNWNDEAPIEEQLATVRAWMDTHLRWLLICDGATDFEAVRALLPAQLKGRVLITGHVPLDAPEVTVLEHPPFPHPAACLFLAHRSQQERDKHVSALVRYFGYGTLPVFLAGAYCHVTDTPVATYRERAEAALKKHEPGQDGTDLFHGALAATALSLQHLSEANPAALELMALCAYLDPQDIALAMLCDGSPFVPKRLGRALSSPEGLNETLTILHRLGLVQFEQNSINVHPTIQAATRFLLGPEQEFAWLMTALRVVLEAFPVESRYTQPIPACSNLVRHAMAVTARSEHANQLRENTGLLLGHVGLYLHACKELDLARECFERAIAQAEAFHGPVHPTVAARANSLGVILQDMGRYEAACASYSRAFHICEAVYGPAREAALGPAHRSMLTMPSRNLCQVLELMGDFPRAKLAYQHAIKVFMDVYCWNHSLVAESMSGLGQLYAREKNWDVARQYFEKAIQAEENADEPEPGNLGKFLRNLAQCHLEVGQPEAARATYEHALYTDRDDLGRVHRHVASDLIGLAKALRELSRFDEAHGRLDEALAIYNTLSREATREKASVWRQKGRTWMDAREFDRAVSCLNEALLTTRMAEGPDSPALGQDYVYLGRALARLDRTAEAEEALLEALALHERHPWMDEEALSNLHGRLGRAAKDLGKLAEAARHLKAALVLDQARLGPDHDQVASAAASLGNLCLAMHERHAAREYLTTARTIYLKTRGPDDPRARRVSQRLEELGPIETD